MESIEEIMEWDRRASRKETMKKRGIAKKEGYNKTKMTHISCHFPLAIQKEMDELIISEHFANRSEFIRFAVANALISFGVYLEEK